MGRGGVMCDDLKGACVCATDRKNREVVDLKERKLNGDQVDSKNIKKHKNDVFRLALLITANGLHTQRKKY